MTACPAGASALCWLGLMVGGDPKSYHRSPR